MIRTIIGATAVLMAVTGGQASAETYLKGAKPLRINPCATWRYPDPIPLPETVHPGLDNRPECVAVVIREKEAPKKVRKAKIRTSIPVPIK